MSVEPLHRTLRDEAAILKITQEIPNKHQVNIYIYFFNSAEEFTMRSDSHPQTLLMGPTPSQSYLFL